MADNYTESSGLKNSSALIVFPDELRTKDYPFIEFSSSVKDGGIEKLVSINLPMPSSIKFGESGSYSSIDMGIPGAMTDTLSNALEKGLTSGGSIVDKFIAGGNAAIDDLKKKISSTSGAEAAQIISQAAGINRDFASTYSKSIVNPNSRTAFKGNSIRSFSFDFKLVAKSQSEAYAIRRLVRQFQRNIYAESMNDLTMRYPSIWTIKFYDTGGKENLFLPKILGSEGDGCYLKEFSSNFNSSSNLWHHDGAPLEVDISLGFTESRMLTRSDIDILTPELDKGESKEKRIKKSLIGDIKKMFKKSK